jgi:hypothetical protein
VRLLEASGRGGTGDDPVAGAYGGPARTGVPSVAVLVELNRTPGAGGHVKCWEPFAHAAAGLHRPGSGWT